MMTLTPFWAPALRGIGQAAVLALCALSGTGYAEEPPRAPEPFYASYGMVTVNSEETVTALQELVGEKVRLVYYRPNNQLLVYGPPEAHQFVREALRDVGTDPRNVRVDVSFDEQSHARATTVSVSGAGGVVIAPEGVDGKVRITPRAESHATDSARLTSQQLLLSNGAEAALRVGETVPFVNELIAWGRHDGTIAHEVTLRHVGASLHVRARIIGDGPLVQVTLTPELSGVSTRQSHRVRFTQVATTLTVRADEPVTLASFGEHADFYRLFLAGVSRAHQATDKRITLRVTLEAPTSAPEPLR